MEPFSLGPDWSSFSQKPFSEMTSTESADAMSRLAFVVLDELRNVTGRDGDAAEAFALIVFDSSGKAHYVSSAARNADLFTSLRRLVDSLEESTRDVRRN